MNRYLVHLVIVMVLFFSLEGLSLVDNEDAATEPAALEKATLEAAASINETAEVVAPVDAAVEVVAQEELVLPPTNGRLEPDSEGVFPALTHKGDIADFLKLLSVSSHRNIVPSSQVRGPITVNLYNVTLQEALDAVLTANNLVAEKKGSFIFVYTQKEHDQMVQAARRAETRTFQMNYISPADVMAMIAPLMSDVGEVTTNSSSSATESESWAGASYVIVSDYPDELDKMAQLIIDLDRRPQQVLVEATILVASLDDTNELGIDFQVIGGVNFQADAGIVGGVPTGSVALTGTETSAGTEFSSNVTTGGLSIGIVKNNIGLFIQALESITDVVTLGNPKVLTLNRQQGKVIVGNRDGYITTEVSQTTATQTIEFLETGTQLSFRPHVMEDGYVRMELNPKDSDGGVVVEGNFTLPSESTAEVTTQVLIKDGHTVVIGGLFRERNSLSRSQVPLLGNVPVLGALFRSTSDICRREEVIFLITPHIVKEHTDYAAGEETLEKCDRMLLGSREGLQWLGRRRLAAAHYQWALEHRDEGETDKALWDATLACQMSPAFLDALHLRDELRGDAPPNAEISQMRWFMRDLIESDTELLSAALPNGAYDFSTPGAETFVPHVFTDTQRPHDQAPTHQVIHDTDTPALTESQTTTVRDGTLGTTHQTAEVITTVDDTVQVQ